MILQHKRTEITSVHLKTQFRTWKSVILLKITDGEKWHHFGLKNLPALLQGITSKNNGNYFCISCLHQSKTQDNSSRYQKKIVICDNFNQCDNFNTCDNFNVIPTKSFTSKINMQRMVIFYSPTVIWQQKNMISTEEKTFCRIFVQI